VDERKKRRKEELSVICIKVMVEEMRALSGTEDRALGNIAGRGIQRR